MAAAAVVVAPVLAADGAIAAAILPAFALLLVAAAAAVIYAGRRLMRALRAAELSRSELQVTMDNMSQGLVVCNTAANVVAVNHRFLELFGIDADPVRPDMAVAELIRLQAEAGDMAPELADVLIHEKLSRQPGSSGRLELPFQQSVFEVVCQPRPEGGWCCTFEDVTARKAAERRLAFLAQHDPLTHLPNRALLRERVDAAVAAEAVFAVMLIDLDHFKLANDTFGPCGRRRVALCRLQTVVRRDARQQYGGAPGRRRVRHAHERALHAGRGRPVRRQADPSARRAVPGDRASAADRLASNLTVAPNLPDLDTALDTDMLLHQQTLPCTAPKRMWAPYSPFVRAVDGAGAGD